MIVKETFLPFWVTSLIGKMTLAIEKLPSVTSVSDCAAFADRGLVSDRSTTEAQSMIVGNIVFLFEERWFFIGMSLFVTF